MSDRRIFDPNEMSQKELYFLMIGCIVPRPIAFVSTVSEAGMTNLAPMSFYNGVSASPPVLSVSIASRRGEVKDTLRNIEETGEFVVNAVDEALAERANLASGDYPPETSEFDITGLTPVASDLVRPPRVAESPVQMECRLRTAIPIGEAPARTVLVLGDVLRFHVRNDLPFEGGHVDAAKLAAVGKMGGFEWCRTGDRFSLKRPR